jgi:hypothetical protein
MLRPIGIAAALSVSLWASGMPALAQNLVPCARENEFCRVPYPTQVVYGVPGRSTAVDVGGRGIPCSNEAFGDPARGIPKRCAYIARGSRDWDRGEPSRRAYDEPSYRQRESYGEVRRERHREVEAHRFGDGEDGYRPSGWRTCASENGFCEFGGVRRVRYGVRGRFVEGTYRNGTACSNSVFGDPVPGQPKICQALD